MPIEEDDIADLAKAPRKTQGDEGAVEERSVDELVKADRYEQSKKAKSPLFGARASVFRKPGTP